MTNYPLPKNVSNTLQQHHQKIKNIGLALDRMVEWDSSYKAPKGMKKGAFEQVIERAQGFSKDEQCKRLIEGLQKRHQACLQSYKSNGLSTWQETLEIDWRLTIGLGSASILETGLTTHRIYGVPYIPGSALKGLARSWAFWTLAECVGITVEPFEEQEKITKNNQLKTPAKILDELLSIPLEKWKKYNKPTLNLILEKINPLIDSDVKEFQSIFGTQERVGNVIFFDALPIEPPTLKLDVMNPHYGDYYQGREIFPVEWLDPVPVYFLTVEKNRSHSLSQQTTRTLMPQLKKRASGFYLH